MKQEQFKLRHGARQEYKLRSWIGRKTCGCGKIFLPFLLIFALRQRASAVSSWITLSFYILLHAFLGHCFNSPVLPACAGSIQESTSQGLCGHKIVLEGSVKSLLCIFGRCFWKARLQSSTSVDKGIFLLIILANSQSITLMSYAKICLASTLSY